MKAQFERVILKDIAQITSGGTPSRSNSAYWNGNIPWIKTTQIQNCRITESDVDEWITEEGLKKSSSKLIPAGSILLAMYGQGKTRGQIGLLTFTAAINQACAAIITNKKADRDYIYHYLLGNYKRIRMLSNTGGQDNLSLGIIESITLCLPPLPEQKAIADLLSTWDEAIEKMERLVRAKEKRFKWLLKRLTHQDLSSHTWQGYNLSDLCSPITRKNGENNMNVLTSSAQNGLVCQLDYYNKTVSAKNVACYYLLKKGEFAYNRSSAKGYPFGAIKRLDNYEKGVLSTLYLCFALKPNAPCESDFLLHLFESGVANRELRLVCQEGARSHGLLNIAKDDFFGIKLFLPTRKQQKQIQSALNTAKEEIHLLKQLSDKYVTQKRGLMQKMLTGKWRIKQDVIKANND